MENSRGGGLRQLTAFDSAFHQDTRARDVKSLLREREREDHRSEENWGQSVVQAELKVDVGAGYSDSKL